MKVLVYRQGFNVYDGSVVISVSVVSNRIIYTVNIFLYTLRPHQSYEWTGHIAASSAEFSLHSSAPGHTVQGRKLQPARFASMEQCYSSLRKQVAKCRYAWKIQWSWHTAKPALCPLHYHNWWGAKGSDKVMAYPMPLLYEMEIPFVGICIKIREQ